MEFTLPALPYSFGELEPYIDRETMEIHYYKHHAAYVANLNRALASAPHLKSKTIEELLSDECAVVPPDKRVEVRNNGGGHMNHCMYWQIMGPHEGGDPKGRIGDQIKKQFGSFDQFRKVFSSKALAHFGSGWTWLTTDRSGKLEVFSTSNQDNPVMFGKYPIMGLDIWEHAYYLKYQNRRAEYISHWWNVVNWGEIDDRHSRAVPEYSASSSNLLSILAGVAAGIGIIATANASIAIRKDKTNEKLINEN